jgi:hypothetical protein
LENFVANRICVDGRTLLVSVSSSAQQHVLVFSSSAQQHVIVFSSSAQQHVLVVTSLVKGVGALFVAVDDI